MNSRPALNSSVPSQQKYCRVSKTGNNTSTLYQLYLYISVWSSSIQELFHCCFMKACKLSVRGIRLRSVAWPTLTHWDGVRLVTCYDRSLAWIRRLGPWRMRIPFNMIDIFEPNIQEEIPSSLSREPQFN